MTAGEAVVRDRVIQVVGLIAGPTTVFDGEFVVEYDPGRRGVEPGTGRAMLCHLVTTPDVSGAARYTAAEAFEVWRSVNPGDPVRPDGQPNRPLTAFSVSIDEAP
jgi:hypothetical protein